MVAEGMLEPATGRYMIDFGSIAQIHVDVDEMQRLTVDLWDFGPDHR